MFSNIFMSALNKANQDSYVICENVAGNKNAHLFGIFDGHGECGDYCSHFAASKVHIIFISKRTIVFI